MSTREHVPPATPLVTVGDIWRDYIGPARVMAVAEGYAMARRPGAAPFVISCQSLREGWEHVK